MIWRGPQLLPRSLTNNQRALLCAEPCSLQGQSLILCACRYISFEEQIPGGRETDGEQWFRLHEAELVAAGKEAQGGVSRDRSPVVREPWESSRQSRAEPMPLKQRSWDGRWGEKGGSLRPFWSSF